LLSIVFQEAIDEVLKTLSEALLIVTLEVFIFLGSWRAVIVPLVAIPLSLVGSLGGPIIAMTVVLIAAY